MLSLAIEPLRLILGSWFHIIRNSVIDGQTKVFAGGMSPDVANSPGLGVQTCKSSFIMPPRCGSALAFNWAL